MNDATHPIVKVLVVDDSALIRKLLTAMLNEAPDIEVVGTASDPYIARERIKQLRPDVLTLDVEMPRMDGVTFLRNLMRLHPMPVVMVSSLTEKGADVTLDALALGAFDFVTKPKLDVQAGIALLAEELQEKVRAAARTPARALSQRAAAGRRADSHGALAGAPPGAAPMHSPMPPPRRHLRTTDRLIAVGASTGGTEAIREVLCALPADAPGIVITQHIPPRFSAAFAKRVDSLAQIRVKEAEHGEVILPGHAYVAPGGFHLRVQRSGGRYLCQIGDDPPVNRHRPSVDVLFDSLADAAGPNVCAALLTGMGADGARGLLALREVGAMTLAQDRATSVVWGMPGEAVKLDAARAILPLGEIAVALLEHSSERAERIA